MNTKTGHMVAVKSLEIKGNRAEQIVSGDAAQHRHSDAAQEKEECAAIAHRITPTFLCRADTADESESVVLTVFRARLCFVLRASLDTRCCSDGYGAE